MTDVAPQVTPRASEQRYGLLLATTLVGLAVQGMMPPSDAQQVVVTGLGALVLVLALRAAMVHGRARRIAVGVIAVIVVLSAADAATGQFGEGAARLMNAALVGLGPPALALGIVRDLRATGRVRLPILMGVLSFYILIGMLFGFLYGAIDRFGGEAFFADGEDATVSRCLYFSFVTLTTVGYGDLVAVTDAGRTLAIFESLIGQIYLVTVVSLIVSNLGRSRRRPEAPERRA